MGLLLKGEGPSSQEDWTEKSEVEEAVWKNKVF